MRQGLPEYQRQLKNYLHARIAMVQIGQVGDGKINSLPSCFFQVCHTAGGNLGNHGNMTIFLLGLLYTCTVIGYC